jgi:hypothetical protein
MGRAGGAFVAHVRRRVIVEAAASGLKLGMGGAGDEDRGVEAGTGVLGGYGVFVGSAMFLRGRQDGSKLEMVGQQLARNPNRLCRMICSRT